MRADAEHHDAEEIAEIVPAAIVGDGVNRDVGQEQAEQPGDREDEAVPQAEQEARRVGGVGDGASYLMRAGGERGERGQRNQAAGKSFHLRTQPRRTSMADTSNIKEHMKVIGADGVHLGTVDHMDGDRIKLTKADSPQGPGGEGAKHHWIPAGLVAEVEGDTVRLSATAQNAQDMFEEAE